MERPTKEITTPSGTKVVLKTYITGGEYRQIQAIFTKDIKITAGGDVELDNMKIAEEAENKAMEVSIVTMDGSDKDILKRVEELPLEDFQYLIEELNKLQEGLSKKK